MTPRALLRAGGFLPAVLLLWAGAACAQELEPRSFSQVPVGMNFAALTLGYAEGSMLFDQATNVEDVTGEITSLGTAYVRSLDFFGASAAPSSDAQSAARNI